MHAHANARLAPFVTRAHEPAHMHTYATGAALDEVSRIQMVEGLFLFALIWSAGCTGDGAGRARFNEFFRVLSIGDVPHG